jgi:hypothetical protein
MQCCFLLAASALGGAFARPVDRYSASWSIPSLPMGRPSPPDGPYAGNGDVTVMFVGNASRAMSSEICLNLVGIQSSSSPIEMVSRVVETGHDDSRVETGKVFFVPPSDYHWTRSSDWRI